MIAYGIMSADLRIGADPSAEDIAQAVWNGTFVETGFTMMEAMRIMAAALAGKVEISGGTHTFRDLTDSEARITATVDGDGQRTSVTLNGS
jgi:hypothetical protein